MQSDHRNGTAVSESLHRSYNSGSNGRIGEQGGRSMVCILVGFNDGDAGVGDIDENGDAVDRREKNQRC